MYVYAKVGVTDGMRVWVWVDVQGGMFVEWSAVVGRVAVGKGRR